MARPYTPRKTLDWQRLYADSFFTGPQAHRDYLVEFGTACHICGVDEGGEPTDHLYPIGAGGITVLGNLAVACSTCNRARGDKHPLEYYAERLAAKQKTSFPTLKEYARWLSTYMKPFKRNYPGEYATAAVLSAGAKRDHKLAQDNYLRELANFRWRTIYDPLLFSRLSIPTEFEEHWKQVYQRQLSELFLTAEDKATQAYNRRKNSNDPKWILMLERAPWFKNFDERDDYILLTEKVFDSVELKGYKSASRAWTKVAKASKRFDRKVILLALKASKPKKTIAEMLGF